jgi:hypothetical protein
MKNISLALGLIAVTSFAAPELVIYPEQLHVPLGFDSNDDIQVIFTRILPDTCHRPLGVVKIDGDQITIDIKEEKSSTKNKYCIKAINPYMISIPLGHLDEGTYKVISSDNKQKVYELTVGSPNSESIDNFTYANITSVEKTENNTIILSGEHPNDCLNIEEVKIIPNGTLDTFSILPITATTNTVCNQVITPFSIEVPIDFELKNAVFHVRKSDGTAINFQ